MYPKPKKILVDGSDNMVVAHQLSDNYVEIVRMDQKFIITGNDFSVIASSPKHLNGKNVFTTITATNGKIDESDLTYRSEKPEDQPPEGKQFKLDDDGKQIIGADGKPELEDIPAE